MLLMCLVPSLAWTAEKPNVLLIMLDDAGYSDVAGFGRNDAPTPNLKKLADEGVRFTRHYADSTCRPARLALMTGRESARVAQNPDFRGISPEIITLPEALKSAGYSTHHFGKWHLGDSVREAWPDRQGFDSWFGFLNQFQLKGPDKNGIFSKRPTYINPFLQGSEDAYHSYPGHLEDILAERVRSKIRTLANDKNTPWFINYWTFAPHHPSVASAVFLAQFPDTPAGKYQALLAQVDADIGSVIETLRETQQLDNTLIVLVSDNGGTNEMMNNNDPFAGIKGGFEEGSLRTPLIIRWPDKRHAGETQNAVVAIQDIYPTVLAAVGIKPVVSLDGQDLQPLLEGKPLQPRLLVHEILTPGLFNFSILSEDGVWRRTPDALFNLQASPAGDSNIIQQSKSMAEKILQQYQKWREQKIAVPVQRVTNATEQFTGDSFRRAPGYGAFSIAIGMQLPLPDGATVLSQAGIWSLTLEKNRVLKLTIGKETAESKPLLFTKVKQGECIALVMSSYFSRSRLHEGKNTGRMRIYANGEKVLEKIIDNPDEIDGDLNEPTIVGQQNTKLEIDGTKKLSIRMGEPLFFNAELPDAKNNAWGEYTIDQAGKKACESVH
jgi:arylsulfatase A-like enzyme